MGEEKKIGEVKKEPEQIKYYAIILVAVPWARRVPSALLIKTSPNASVFAYFRKVASNSFSCYSPVPGREKWNLKLKN